MDPISDGGLSSTDWGSDSGSDSVDSIDVSPSILETENTTETTYESALPETIFTRQTGQVAAQQVDPPVDIQGPNGPLTTEHVIEIDSVPMVYTPEGAVREAYRTFGESQGLTATEAQDFANQAYALTDGQVFAPSSDPNQDGAVLSQAELQTQLQAGRLEIGVSRAQLGLLHATLAQPADTGTSILGPLGAAGLGTQFMPGPANVIPGQSGVAADVALSMLENMADGRAPFRPDLGHGGVSWFVTEGEPYTGRRPANSVTIPVDIEVPNSANVLEFNETQLLEIFEAEHRSALTVAEQQYRATNGIPANQTLSNTAMRRVQRHAANIAERAMWQRVGQAVAASDSGLGRVNLVNSKFSQSGNGVFTLVSNADAVKVRGGAGALIDVLERSGQPVDDAVREAAERLATQRNWTGRLRGVFRVGGRVLVVVGAAADGYRIYSADDKLRATAEVAGGWAGATAAGGAFATWAAPVNATGPWGWAAYGVGTLVAGGVGYFAGEAIAGEVYELVVDNDPMFFGPQD